MASSLRKCLNHSDSFCYIFGGYTFMEQRKFRGDFVKRAYLSYFKIKLGDQDKTWASYIICKTCVKHLWQWTNGKRKCLKFGISIVCKEQRNHREFFYFCLVNIKGLNGYNCSKWTFPELAQ